MYDQISETNPLKNKQATSSNADCHLTLFLKDPVDVDDLSCCINELRNRVQMEYDVSQCWRNDIMQYGEAGVEVNIAFNCDNHSNSSTKNRRDFIDQLYREVGELFCCDFSVLRIVCPEGDVLVDDVLWRDDTLEEASYFDHVDRAPRKSCRQHWTEPNPVDDDLQIHQFEQGET
jgi:hypothetical protein